MARPPFFRASERIYCVLGTKIAFHMADFHARRQIQIDNALNAALIARLFGFERILRADHPPDAVQPQTLQAALSHMHMPGVGGIKGAAKQPYGLRIIQGLICPLPST